ncbi:MAG: helix-turn-helix domain-containing protein [Oscillospiraceae bacterium]|nr:helix-turn-helix domain-containing protein [Oscillospiraceae bacterium]
MNSPSTKKEWKKQLAHYPDLLTTQQISELMHGVQPQTILNMIYRDEIKSIKMGNRYLISKESLIDFLVTEKSSYLIEQRISKQTIFMPDEVERTRHGILIMCDQPQTRQRLMEVFHIKSRKTFFRLYLHPLLESGQLQMTEKSQNTVSTQRYVRVRRHEEIARRPAARKGDCK